MTSRLTVGKFLFLFSEATLSYYSELLGVGDLCILSSSRGELGKMVSEEIGEGKEMKAEEEKGYIISRRHRLLARGYSSLTLGILDLPPRGTALGSS